MGWYELFEAESLKPEKMNTFSSQELQPKFDLENSEGCICYDHKQIIELRDCFV